MIETLCTPCGSAPRARGTRLILWGQIIKDGSAPRARGTPSHPPVPPVVHRFSPASAGNTQRQDAKLQGYPVQPRERGEHAWLGEFPKDFIGSAPRARGTQEAGGCVYERTRFSPASAGNTYAENLRASFTPVQPRERGEHMVEALEQLALAGSPRERGEHSSWQAIDRQSLSRCQKAYQEFFVCSRR